MNIDFSLYKGKWVTLRQNGIDVLVTDIIDIDKFSRLQGNGFDAVLICKLPGYEGNHQSMVVPVELEYVNIISVH